jgi:hypothetical protein
MVFPWVLDVTEPEEMAEQRELLLKDVKGEILEIGIGTGVNLPYYPKQIYHITRIEPSDVMQSRAFNIAPRTGLFYEPFLHDLELIWQVDSQIDGFEQVDISYA